MHDIAHRTTLQMAMAAPAPRYRITDPHVHVLKHDPRLPFARSEL